MKKIILALSLVSLAGCKDMTGNLNVFKNFTANVKHGQETIQKGNYETTLDFKRDRVVAKLKSGSQTVQMTIMIPAGTNIPNNGNFELKAAQSGQPFTILGTNKTDEKRSELRYGYQQCQVQDYQTVCDQYGCHQVIVNRWGQQYTEYYDRTVTEDLTMNMMDSSSNAKLAQFTGHSAFSERVLVRQDRCF